MRYGMNAAAAYALARSLPAGPLPDGTAHAGARDFVAVMGLNYDPEWREAKVYEPTNGDGHRVVVLVARMPAQFWRVVCPDLGLDLGTGSGLGDLATAMAEAIADGCLGPHAEAAASDERLEVVAATLTKAIERLGTDRARAMADLRRIINSDDPAEIDDIANACLDALSENTGLGGLGAASEPTEASPPPLDGEGSDAD